MSKKKKRKSVITETLKPRDDFLFGTNESLTIKRFGKSGIVFIGNRDLIGVEEIEIKIIANKPIQYVVKGEVVV